MDLNKKQIGVIFFVIFLIFIGGIVNDLVLVFLAFPNLYWVWALESKIFKKLHIVSDGTSGGTYVNIGKYSIEHVNKIVIKPLSPGELVVAEITVLMPGLIMSCDSPFLKDIENELGEGYKGFSDLQLDQLKNHLLVERTFK